ncbi:hypothetical protein OQJ18_06710 [Fluoribacter dumoffii]|uniref:Lipoprotein n=1 Tax=Fluoribacter dumoffii TaxID=463 RepID=A0A377G882_9GAMM|nr:hypothetical protein [Fluoribacter dumoffii]KTC89867.1 hypothetical protein Ldum_0935 [Fluoribacter dumoffii NY 23]MCW8385163.1 hypothetical protein [Fluoribacter dumoffii]MCW8418218.1 hypothetical protein [Fluoribacter dumoffii]MCW8453940.1 hypothetical protein [Fluoribacter dumoffii]MCW8461989.1 hypothetical protein [Fluoribacter dumoffii]
MKRIITSSTLLISLSLMGCNTMNNVSQYSNSTVGAGVNYGARVVGTGVGYVADTGAFVGKGVGTVIDTGVGTVMGSPSKYTSQPGYHNKHIVYRNGHRYMLENGRYVLVH